VEHTLDVVVLLELVDDLLDLLLLLCGNFDIV
jgi:hypothetical protein